MGFDNCRRFISRVAMAIALATVPVAHPQQPAAESLSNEVRPLIEAGVAAFKAARYEDAKANFLKATRLEPANKQARLYLATTYSYQVVPNLETPENLKTASAALSEFEMVLRDDPHNLEALRQKAAIYRNIKQLDQAKAMEKEVIAAEPNDAEAYYTIGVIDWTQAYKNAVAMLAKESLTDDGMGNAKLSNAGCDGLEQKNASLVEEAMVSLEQAIRLKPNYDDAMQYLNLVFRRRAELHCHDRSAAEADIALALEWNAKGMKARKENEEVMRRKE